jgi:PBP1b-binding outer membrane lipoprotein LpoB
MKRTLLFISVTLIMIGCGGGTQYRDASKDQGSMEWGPREIKTTVNKMVGSLYKYLKSDWNQPAMIKVQRIKNDTAEHIDTRMLADEIVTNLIQMRIQFIDDSYSKEALSEMEKGMTGLVDPDSAVPVGNLKSPNLYLYGTITENVRYVGGKKVQYVVVTLAMKELKSQLLKWMDRQEFLKATTTDRVSF